MPFTPEATIGPFYPGAFASALPQDLWEVSPLMAHRPSGRPLRLTLRVWDSVRRPVPSAVIEFWQANAHGRYRHPADRWARLLDPQFDGFARLRTSDEGVVQLRTIMPGPHPVGDDGRVMRAPHLRLTIFASGIDRLVTQLFFDGEPLNDQDPILNSITDASVRRRLVARQSAPSRMPELSEYELDLVLRGDEETPFFDDWE